MYQHGGDGGSVQSLKDADRQSSMISNHYGRGHLFEKSRDLSKPYNLLYKVPVQPQFASMPPTLRSRSVPLRIVRPPMPIVHPLGRPIARPNIPGARRLVAIPRRLLYSSAYPQHRYLQPPRPKSVPKIYRQHINSSLHQPQRFVPIYRRPFAASLPRLYGSERNLRYFGGSNTDLHSIASAPAYRPGHSPAYRPGSAPGFRPYSQYSQSQVDFGRYDDVDVDRYEQINVRHAHSPASALNQMNMNDNSSFSGRTHSETRSDIVNRRLHNSENRDNNSNRLSRRDQYEMQTVIHPSNNIDQLRGEQFATYNGYSTKILPNGAPYVSENGGSKSKRKHKHHHQHGGGSKPLQRFSSTSDTETTGSEIFMKAKEDSRLFPRDWYNSDSRRLPNERAFAFAIRQQREHVTEPDKFPTAYDINHSEIKDGGSYQNISTPPPPTPPVSGGHKSRVHLSGKYGGASGKTPIERKMNAYH